MHSLQGKKMKYGAVICLYDDHEYLDPVIESISPFMEKILFIISDIPWNGKPSDNSSTINKVQDICSKNPACCLIRGKWDNEWDQRNYGLELLQKEAIHYCLVIDNDEVYHQHHLRNIIEYVEKFPTYDAFHIEWNTYWKKSYYRIHPRENFKPLIMVKTNSFLFTGIRLGTTEVIKVGSKTLMSPSAMNKYNGTIIPPNIATCYHLSYARSDDFMLRKLETNSHAREFIPEWFDNVWKKWTPEMKNLHPVTPEQYQKAIPEDFSRFPTSLKRFIKKEKLPQRRCTIIIPNWNSAELLRDCINHIRMNTSRPYKIIIIDNGSTKDDSVEYIKSLGVKAIFNAENKGFPASINQGIRASTDDVCILNVDAQVHKGWLDELYKTMINNPDCGMAGPLGNDVPSRHQCEGYVKNDTRTPNLHGFCILILKELINKIGLFDERYSLGGYEDSDYGIRAKLAGYELYISARSLVIHKAHQVYKLNDIDNYEDQKGKEYLYYNKFFGILLDYGKIYDLYENELFARNTGLLIT